MVDFSNDRERFEINHSNVGVCGSNDSSEMMHFYPPYHGTTRLKTTVFEESKILVIQAQIAFFCADQDEGSRPVWDFSRKDLKHSRTLAGGSLNDILPFAPSKTKSLKLKEI